MHDNGRFAEDTQDHELPLPDPLYREPPEAVQFPVDSLLYLADAARAIEDIIQCPIAIGAQSLLTTASLAAQALIDIKLPYGDVKPPSLFAVTIGRTGERKNAADKHASWPAREFEARAMRRYRETDLPAYERDHAMWAAQRQRALKSGSLASLGREPARPVNPMLLTDDLTFEGLCKLFMRGSRTVGLFATEGGKFLGGAAMFEDAKIRTATGLSNLWDGEAIRRVRAGDDAEPTVISDRRLSMHLMVQPDIAGDLYSDRQISSQGLLSRCLLEWPVTAMGERTYRDPAPASREALRGYNVRMRNLLEAVEPQKFEVSLAPKAKERWVSYYNGFERRLKADLADVADFVNKMPEQAIRIAGVLLIAGGMQTDDIADAQMEAGIALAEHYTDEVKRLHTTVGMNPEIARATRVLRWLGSRGKKEEQVSLRDIYRSGPSDVRTREAAMKVVAVLEEHGWLIQLVSKKDEWQLHPQVFA